MKSILISIRPEWCGLIASGKKTIEVRKTRPKDEPPFKCLIYCTKSGYLYVHDTGCIMGEPTFWNGKIIGEFICDKIIEIDCDSVAPFDYQTKEYIDNEICFGRDEYIKYAGLKRTYGWHISDLVIYDEPRELSDFFTPEYVGRRIWVPGHKVEKAPQSWCYVEKKENKNGCY